MQRFAKLYRELDASTATRDKQAALQRYFMEVPAEDAAWAVYFLAGGKPRQLVPTRALRTLAQQTAGLPEWLFEESYQTVGDLAETVSLLLPPASAPVGRGLAGWLTQHLLPLRGLPPEALAERLRAHWNTLPDDQRFVYFKLITGGFRVGVSKLQVTQALAAVAGVAPQRVAQRLMGYTVVDRRPSADDYAALVAPESTDEQHQQTSGQPYPFFLAHPFNEALERFDELLGPPSDWQVEWKWDGIRAQLIQRAGQVWLWSRGEELVTERFPELAALGDALPDGTVLDGEIVVWHRPPQGAASNILGAPQPFSDLQKRIGRKTLGPKILREQPVALLVYDLLEHGGQDLREQALHARRAALDALVQHLNHPLLIASPLVTGATWAELATLREQARTRGTEGFMLKQRASAYGVGRTKAAGTWWKWKIDPMSVDAVLIYAQRGHGRRASVYSDYTFAVWNAPPGTEGRQLVPFAKAYSGLTDAEMAKVDAIIRATTIESFGPVRSVRPTLVFELGFEGIARSPRHKSGIAVRFPRMLRWREDKPVDEADTLQTLATLLPRECHTISDA
jgi:DNA ligase-1